MVSCVITFAKYYEELNNKKRRKRKYRIFVLTWPNIFN